MEDDIFDEVTGEVTSVARLFGVLMYACELVDAMEQLTESKSVKELEAEIKHHEEYRAGYDQEASRVRAKGGRGKAA